MTPGNNEREPVHVAITFHGGFGHTARQAEAVARGVASIPGATVSLHDASGNALRSRRSDNGQSARTIR